MDWINELKFDDQGLIPAIIQDAEDGEILMMAWMNKESVKDSMDTGKCHFWSRSRNKKWMKGESSGNVQEIKDCYFDCDKDVLLFKVKQVGGAACHTGFRSCFHTQVDGDETRQIGEKVFDPDEVYGKK